MYKNERRKKIAKCEKNNPPWSPGTREYGESVQSSPVNTQNKWKKIVSILNSTICDMCTFSRPHKISIHVVKNIYIQQVNSGVADCVAIVGTWFNSCGGFFIFFLLNKWIHLLMNPFNIWIHRFCRWIHRFCSAK